MAKQFITVSGIREMALAAKKFPEEVKRKIVGKALIAGARFGRDAARALAPTLKAEYHNDPRRSPGTLKRNIVAVRVRRGDFPEEVMAIVGIRLLSKKSIASFKAGNAGKAGADNPNDPFYGVMVEVGSRAHKRRNKAIPKVEFLKRGFESTASRSVTKIKDVSGKEIYDYGNRLAR